MVKTEYSKIKKVEIKSVFDRTLHNFKKEMNQPFKEYENAVPSDMKAYIFDILCKHFVISLLCEKKFMQEIDRVSEINQRIKNLMG
jgi:hypothetical protein